DVQNALNNLPSMISAGGSVTVTLSGNVYTVTFGGSLSQTNVQQMTAAGANRATPIVQTTRDGPEGTVVGSGATPPGQGNINVASEALMLSGTGFNNAGALENVSGNNTWARGVTLGSNVSIGVDASTDTLAINGPIADNGNGFGVTKIGPGTLDYRAANTYTG